ncbi:TIMELESS-interacting protein [Thalassophryne amazonica]|uniref:TIMELESS-interacting protein n=1 Tax=Thalassophryne amazonica TaxID=390379 RepID=UPI0014719053|nr:TIMELESS-interacting protein [Thalassophryne amazonica]
MYGPQENGLHDLSDDDHPDSDVFLPLPPPHSPGQGGPEEGGPFADGEEGGGGGEVSKLAEVPALKRKGVRRPQPKLDSERLTSDRGLPALRTLFDHVHFKGKGHEAEDLLLLMQKMENWAHRLYPKLQFEDFIDKVEKLGSKKDVQTCLKRIRLDMPLTHDDFIDNPGEDEVSPEANIFGDPEPFGDQSLPDDPPRPAHSTPAAAGPALSEEQRERMELNRRRALERRLARQQQQTDSQPVDLSEEDLSAVATTLVHGGSDEGKDDQVKEPDLEPSEPSLTNSEFSPEPPQLDKAEPCFSPAQNLEDGD